MIVWLSLFLFSLGSGAAEIRVGSKNFTESYILGEMVAQTIEDATSHSVKRVFGIGGTGMVYEALKKGEIDLYVEYTGTLAEAILKSPRLRSIEKLSESLAPLGLVMGGPLGFNNTYALAVRREFARENGLRTISDLKKNGARFRVAFSYEFMSRADGFEALKAHYRLPFGANVRRMDHSLVYGALENNQVDLIEVYATDPKIQTMDLVVLEDDLKFFPTYEAVILARADFVKKQPEVWAVLKKLEGRLNETVMRSLNESVEIQKKSFEEAVSAYMENGAAVKAETVASRIWRRTKEHAFLVLVSLLFSIAVGVPLGILAHESRVIGQSVLVVSSVIQTIPSLALLCFLIPVLGVGVVPALVALVMYGLLPVVVNTFEGLHGIDPRLMESARTLSLTGPQRLFRIYLPMASPNILAGIRTSTVIGIGTATLAAFIGAGGYGAPIITGLALNDMRTILIGAIPAAGMALLAHLLFELLRRWLIPRGLRSA